MKTLLYISTIFIFISCKAKQEKQFILSDKTGEWRIDSIIGQDKTHRLGWAYIYDDKFWRLNKDTCPIIIDSNFTFLNDSIFQREKLVYTVSAKDSLTLLLKSTTGTTYYLKNISKSYGFDTDIKADLYEYLQKDTLIRKVVGWWKLENATYRPIKLINYPEQINDFTLHLDDNGNATFYVDNLKDSTITYGWTTNKDGLSFSRLCIAGSESTITEIEKTKMKIIIDFRSYNELTLIRTNPIVKK